MFDTFHYDSEHKRDIAPRTFTIVINKAEMILPVITKYTKRMKNSSRIKGIIILYHQIHSLPFQKHQQFNQLLSEHPQHNKIKNLEKRSITEGMGTWAFKLKYSPHSTLLKFQMRYYMLRDLQGEGVDYFETCAPSIQWSTIHLS